jgi:hypothetical protein
MAAENPPGATDASTVNLPSLDKRSHRARCGCSSDDAVSTRHPGASLTWQQFLAAQAEGPWPATSSMLRPSCSSACTAVRAGGLHSPGPYPWRDGQPNRGRVAQQARNGSVALVAGRQGGETPGMRTAHRSRRSILACSAFAGFRFPSDVIVLAVRWYLRFSLDYPRRRGTAHRAGCRGGPRDGLPVGAAVHAAAGRGRSAVPTRRR